VQEGEDGFSDDVEYTVEVHFRVGSDDVCTVTETPGDGVQGPDEGEVDGRGDVGFPEVCRKEGGRLVRRRDRVVDKVR
jgi:hypothetical protein